VSEKKRWDSLLPASTFSGDAMSSLFSMEKNFFIAYRKATLSLSFNALDRQFYATINKSSGGFEDAATTYANALA